MPIISGRDNENSRWKKNAKKKKIKIKTGVNPLSLIINKTNGYIKESNGNKYLTLVPTDES